MKSTVLSLIGILLGGAALVVGLLPHEPKIAFAETSVLLAEFSEAAKARREYEKQQAEWNKNLKTLNDSLLATMERMKTEYEKADPNRKNSLRAAFQQRNEDLQRYTNAVKEMALTKEKELMDPVIKKLNSYLDQWGREKGYDLILGTMSGGNILQANPEYNVTSQVLRSLNDHYRALPATMDTAKAASKDSGQNP